MRCTSSPPLDVRGFCCYCFANLIRLVNKSIVFCFAFPWLLVRCIRWCILSYSHQLSPIPLLQERLLPIILYDCCSFFPSVLLRYNWHITLYKFKVCSIMIWLIYCEMITTINLVNIQHLIQIKISSLWWELLGCTLNNFQIYHTLQPQ